VETQGKHVYMYMPYMLQLEAHSLLTSCMKNILLFIWLIWFVYLNDSIAFSCEYEHVHARKPDISWKLT